MKQVLATSGRKFLVAAFAILTILGIVSALIGVSTALSVVFNWSISGVLIALVWVLGGLVLIRVGYLLFGISEGKKPVQRIREKPSEILRVGGDSLGTWAGRGLEAVLMPLVVLAAVLFFFSIPTIVTAIVGAIVIAVMYVFVTSRDVIEIVLMFLLGGFS